MLVSVLSHGFLGPRCYLGSEASAPAEGGNPDGASVLGVAVDLRGVAGPLEDAGPVVTENLGADEEAGLHEGASVGRGADDLPSSSRTARQFRRKIQ